jgi:hypothetical protein
MGIRSLAAAVRAQCLRTFERGARLPGATHLKGLPIEAGSTPAAQHALDVVEFDGHRLDVRLKVVVRDPLGFEQEFEIERIWLLVIVDVWSRAVLGYHVSLNREYSRYDVIRTIENALAPHRPRQVCRLKTTASGVALPRRTSSTRGCSVRRFAVPSAAGPTRVGAPGWYRKRQRLNCVERSRERASVVDRSGIFSSALTIKKAVTTLLRCLSTHCEVTLLLRNPLETRVLARFWPIRSSSSMAE